MESGFNTTPGSCFWPPGVFYLSVVYWQGYCPFKRGELRIVCHYSLSDSSFQILSPVSSARRSSSSFVSHREKASARRESSPGELILVDETVIVIIEQFICLFFNIVRTCDTVAHFSTSAFCLLFVVSSLVKHSALYWCSRNALHFKNESHVI